jgi:hypothetical protein
MIEQAIFFAARHKREPSHSGKHGSRAILPIEPQKRAFLWKVVGSQIPTNGHKPFAQLLSISPVAPIPETAEPLITMRPSNRCACPDNLPAFASGVASSTDLI